MIQKLLLSAQVLSIVTYVGGVFYIYKLLVAQKDSTIELLKERLSAAQETTPDIMAERLSKRVALLEGELGQLSADDDRNRETLAALKADLEQAREAITVFQDQLEEAKEVLSEVSCPYCGSMIDTKEYPTVYGEYEGREIQTDYELITYECGRRTEDGHEVSPCGSSKKTKKP